MMMILMLASRPRFLASIHYYHGFLEYIDGSPDLLLNPQIGWTTELTLEYLMCYLATT